MKSKGVLTLVHVQLHAFHHFTHMYMSMIKWMIKELGHTLELPNYIHRHTTPAKEAPNEVITAQLNTAPMVSSPCIHEACE